MPIPNIIVYLSKSDSLCLCSRLLTLLFLYHYIRSLQQAVINFQIGQIKHVIHISLNDDHIGTSSDSFICQCLKVLSGWSALKKPLGYQDSAYTHLVQINQPQLLSNGLPAISCSPKSVPWFITNIIKVLDSNILATLLPFISNGIILPII